MRNQGPRWRPRRGFTLVELVIVILILGILAGIAAPRLLSVSAEAEASMVLTNVRAIFDAVDLYEAEHGRLPVDSDTGFISPDLVGRLPEALFTNLSPFGEPLDWNGPGTTAPSFGVSTVATGTDVVADRKSYQAIERAADDGSRLTGWITLSGRTLNFRHSPRTGGGPTSGGSLPVTGS